MSIAVEFRAVSKCFGPVEVLHGVSFALPAGRVIKAPGAHADMTAAGCRWGAGWGLEQPLYFQFLNRQLRVASRSCTRGTTMNLDGTTTQQPTEFQQRWTNEHWMLQYDLMFGKGYALNRMGVAGLSGMNTGK